MIKRLVFQNSRLLIYFLVFLLCVLTYLIISSVNRQSIEVEKQSQVFIIDQARLNQSISRYKELLTKVKNAQQQGVDTKAVEPYINQLYNIIFIQKNTDAADNLIQKLTTEIEALVTAKQEQDKVAQEQERERIAREAEIARQSEIRAEEEEEAEAETVDEDQGIAILPRRTPIPDHSTNPDGTITGVIKDKNGIVAGTSVSICYRYAVDACNQLGDIRTDSAGRYAFTLPAASTYQLEAGGCRYINYNRPNTEIIAYKTVVVDIYLTYVDDKK